MMMKLLLYSLFALAAGAYNPVSVEKEFVINGVAQGTTYHLLYVAGESIISKKQVDSIFLKLDSSLSRYKSFSLVSKFNRAADGIEMDHHLHNVIKLSLKIYRETGGISDITVLPVVSLWEHSTKSGAKAPGRSQLKRLQPCVGSNHLQCKNLFLSKDKPCVQIDLDGIAQGYSVDVLANFLETNRIKNYIVEVGGEIRVKGRKPNGNYFQLGIESPSETLFDEPIIRKTLSFDSGAITTSGSYRKFHMNGNKRLSHIINPQTGKPVTNELISVTVFAKEAITADGYDNALLAMGLKKALKFLKQNKDLEAYFIYSKPDGSIADTASAGFNKLIQ